MNKIISTIIFLILLTACSTNKTTNKEVSANENYEPLKISEANNNNQAETNVVIEETNDNIIIKSNTYSGVISDIPIKMQLDYYEDNVVKGKYMYEKYKQNIEITGQIDNNNIILNTTDNTEKFTGSIKDGFISGKWISGDKVLYFNIWNENGDECDTKAGDTFIYDIDNIYYSLNKNLYKSNSDKSSETMLSENGEYENLILHNEKIYFLDSDYIINRIDINGNNLETININQLSDYKIYSFIIYKERIYFIDYNTMDSYDDEFFKFVSTDLDGGNLTEILMPKAKLYDDERYKRYYMSFIYNDYVYFGASELGPEADVFRVKLDGSDLQNTNMLGYPLGCFEDNLYNIGVNSTNIWKDNIGFDANDDGMILYEGIDAYKNEDVDYWNAVMDNSYIVVSYAWKAEQFHNIVVLDLDGNVINEKRIPKRNDDIYTNDEIVVSIINDYVYYKYYNSYHRGESVGRFEFLNYQ